MRCVIVFLVLATGCGGIGSGQGDDTPPMDANGNPPATGVFAASVNRVLVEIDYETGSEPFTGPMIGFGDTFDLFTANLDRLFAGTKQLTVPTTIGAMESIGAVVDEALTVEDLLALAEQHRDSESAGETFTYYVVFVSGNFADMSGARPGVLGVSLGNTGMIAMFKDVIRGSSAFRTSRGSWNRSP